MKVRRIAIRAIVAVGVLVVPLAAEAQQQTVAARIGWLATASREWSKPYLRALREGLRGLGYADNQILIEERHADGRAELLPTLAGQLVSLKVGIIVAAASTQATQAAQQATSTIPIVMVAAGDPVRNRLVASLARPGGNVTGSTILGAELSAKRLQLLKETVPNVSRVAFLWNPVNLSHVTHLEDIQGGARTLSVRLQPVAVSNPNEFESAFATMMREHPNALIVTADSMHNLHARWIIDFAAMNRLPAMYQLKERVLDGGLMSYGASLPDLFRRTATYVDRILKGAKPADLPVEQPTTFELAINLKAARALGLAIPQSILVRADEVIE